MPKPLSQYTALEIKATLDHLFGKGYISSNLNIIQRHRSHWLEGNDHHPPTVEQMIEAGWIHELPRHSITAQDERHYQQKPNPVCISYERSFDPARYEELTGYPHIPKKNAAFMENLQQKMYF